MNPAEMATTSQRGETNVDVAFSIPNTNTTDYLKLQYEKFFKLHENAQQEFRTGI